MPRVHSHYENLKVARDAPPEVIRAAYRSLSQKYHPDRNPGDKNANKIMAIINLAFETLSDPDKRREHDKWIAREEAIGGESQQQRTRRSGTFTVDEEKLRQATKPRSSTDEAGKNFARAIRDPNISIAKKSWLIRAHVLRNWIWYGIAALVIVGILDDKPRTPPPGPKPYVAAPAPPVTTPTYVRPATAPNGEPWPLSPGYVRGYKRLNSSGLSTVTIDNSQNDSDVFVKLVSLDGPNAFPVRTFYISAHGTFTVNQVTAGSYDLRYRDLGTGGLSRSEAFTLEEISTYNGTQFSNITMTLYKVPKEALI
ncbi:J domain-containing protein [Rhodocyclus purpureus]|uniref:J domain-containing protein n=1 Tax=Rhodocyclus purpureus TaxID=1067 RepID=UPI0019139FEF|nr:DnaJ domain-containing protein [Rhodocyclus purpureus]MBK5913605.1 hypothetical protein [Rhodocyclus purpureus]